METLPKHLKQSLIANKGVELYKAHAKVFSVLVGRWSAMAQ